MKIAEQTEHDGWTITVHTDELRRNGEPTRYEARATAIKRVRAPFMKENIRLEIQFETVEFAGRGYATSNEAVNASIAAIKTRIDEHPV